MRQAIAKMIGIACGEDLRFGFEAAKGTAMNDAVAVPRIGAAVGMLWLRKTAPAGFFHVHGPRSRRGGSCDGPLHLVPESCARLPAARWSGLRRNRIQAAVGLFGDVRIRELFLDLLIDARGLFWIRIAKNARKLQQHHGTRHKHAWLVRESAKQLGGVARFSGARVNNGHL